MAFLRNDAINRINLHSGVQALAQAGGGVFFLAFLLRAGFSVPATLTTLAAIFAGRFVARPLILPLARRWGLKPMVMIGALLLALQYPILAEVRGVGQALGFLCVLVAIGDVFYWPSYNAYFAALGDSEHRGHQVSAREALVSTASVIAPLAGAWALSTFGPRPMFFGVAIIQALSTAPLLGAPNVPVKAQAPGALRAARLGMALGVNDGFFDVGFYFLWQIGLFVVLDERYAAFGGAMALAALVGAGCGLILGRHIDAGHGGRVVIIALALAAVVLAARAASLSSPWLAVAANALGALLAPLLIPAIATPAYNLAKSAPCALRFYIAAEAGWDIGAGGGCLIAAVITASGAPLSVAILVSGPGILVWCWLLRRYYADQSIHAVVAPAVPGRDLAAGVAPRALP